LKTLLEAFDVMGEFFIAVQFAYDICDITYLTGQRHGSSIMFIKIKVGCY